MADLVFISYAREDSDFALKLAQSLKDSGVPAWVDQLDIKTGERWDRAVEAALTACTHFLIILSPDSVRSDNVGNELLYARDEQKIVLPVLYKPCKIPIHLRAVQYADFTIRSYDEALTGVINLFTRSHTAGLASKSIPPTKENTTPDPIMIRLPDRVLTRDQSVTQPTPTPKIIPVTGDFFSRIFVYVAACIVFGLMYRVYPITMREDTGQIVPSSQILFGGLTYVFCVLLYFDQAKHFPRILVSVAVGVAFTLMVGSFFIMDYGSRASDYEAFTTGGFNLVGLAFVLCVLIYLWKNRHN